MQELRVKFYLGQNEDCSLGDSTSDSSETLRQRGSGEGQEMCDFSDGGMHAVERQRGSGEGQETRDFSDGGMHAVEHLFFQRISASQVKLSASTRPCHREEFECFSRFEEIQGSGS